MEGGGSWADVIQALYDHGHTPDAVMGYTLAQVRGFTEAIKRREKAMFMQQIVAARMAQYDNKGFKAAMKRLREDG